MPIERIDMSMYHDSGHWPFTKACRSQPHGRGWYHLKLAWEYRRRDQVVGWFFRLRCRRYGLHDDWSAWSRTLGLHDVCHWCGRVTEASESTKSSPLAQRLLRDFGLDEETPDQPVTPTSP